MMQKIAIIHDWLTVYTGSERVVEQLLLLYPDADLFSLVDFLPDNQRQFLRQREVKTSPLQHFPFARKYYRQYLWIMPLLIEQIDLSSYDLVLSSCHAVAKGVITNPDQLHISYIYSPMRYAWDMQHEYLTESGLNQGIKGFLSRLILHYMRIWDMRTINTIDAFVACSQFIARRIWKIYRRKAKVIYPPVEISLFPLCEEKLDYYLVVSRLVEYKKINLIVEAFSEMPEKRLVVIGDGPEFKNIARHAPRNVELLGYQPTKVVSEYMQQARGFIYAAREDFGITLLEAQSCGTPVIAYNQGGATETIQSLESPQPTGVLYTEQTKKCIKSTIELFERSEHRIKPTDCHENAQRFSPDKFRDEFSKFVVENWQQFSKKEEFIPID